MGLIMAIPALILIVEVERNINTNSEMLSSEKKTVSTQKYFGKEMLKIGFNSSNEKMKKILYNTDTFYNISLYDYSNGEKMKVIGSDVSTRSEYHPEFDVVIFDINEIQALSEYQTNELISDINNGMKILSLDTFNDSFTKLNLRLDFADLENSKGGYVQYKYSNMSRIWGFYNRTYWGNYMNTYFATGNTLYQNKTTEYEYNEMGDLISSNIINNNQTYWDEYTDEDLIAISLGTFCSNVDGILEKTHEPQTRAISGYKSKTYTNILVQTFKDPDPDVTLYVTATINRVNDPNQCTHMITSLTQIDVPSCHKGNNGCWPYIKLHKTYWRSRSFDIACYNSNYNYDDATDSILYTWNSNNDYKYRYPINSYDSTSYSHSYVTGKGISITGPSLTEGYQITTSGQDVACVVNNIRDDPYTPSDKWDGVKNIYSYRVFYEGDAPKYYDSDHYQFPAALGCAGTHDWYNAVVFKYARTSGAHILQWWENTDPDVHIEKVKLKTLGGVLIWKKSVSTWYCHPEDIEIYTSASSFS